MFKLIRWVLCTMSLGIAVLLLCVEPYMLTQHGHVMRDAQLAGFVLASNVSIMLLIASFAITPRKHKPAARAAATPIRKPGNDPTCERCGQVPVTSYMRARDLMLCSICVDGLSFIHDTVVPIEHGIQLRAQLRGTGNEPA